MSVVLKLVARETYVEKSTRRCIRCAFHFVFAFIYQGTVRATGVAGKGPTSLRVGLCLLSKSHFRAEMRGGQGSNGALRTQVVAVSTVEALIRFTAAEELRTADAL